MLAVVVITVAVALNVSFLRFYPESCLSGYDPIWDIKMALFSIDNRT